ncbi:uncharacterized protein LOC143856155 [Tasmannia lanceolata]|uniref:uncharacterized protein LOC143856155 n=1 Tax=Tasmannia lanceolata TaxID=3420 RepID=UPI0040641B48
MSRGQSKLRIQSGRRNLERFKDEGKFDNVVIIDVDKGKSHNVVIIDVPESSQQNYKGSGASRTKKKCPPRGTIIIDDKGGGNDDNDPRSDDSGDLDSDATSNKKFCPASSQSHVSKDSDSEDCQIFSQERNFTFKLSKCMQKSPGKEPSRNRFGLYADLEISSSESDSSDCELMEGSCGKIREQWEEAALRKKVLEDIHNSRFGVEDMASVSGSNTDPKNSCHETIASRKIVLEDIYSGRFGVEDLASGSGSNTDPRNSCHESAPKNVDVENNNGSTYSCTPEQSGDASSEKDILSTCTATLNKNMEEPFLNPEGYNPVGDSDRTIDQDSHERAGFQDKEENVSEKPSFCKNQSYEVEFDHKCAVSRDRENLVPGEPSLCDSQAHNNREANHNGASFGDKGQVPGEPQDNNGRASCEHKQEPVPQEPPWCNTHSRNDMDVNHDRPCFVDKEELYCEEPSSSDAQFLDGAQDKDEPFPGEPPLCNTQSQYSGQVSRESANCQDKDRAVFFEPSSCNNKSQDGTHGYSRRDCLQGNEELVLGEPSLCGTQQPDETLGKGVTLCAGTTNGLLGFQSDLIGGREKHKETDEFKRASEEEWASRQKQMQIQAEEAQRLRKRKKAETLRLLDMERRQKQRVEEMRELQKKDEETINLKEQLRVEIRKELDKLELKYRDMASLLRALGIHVGGGPYPMSREVNAAYKQALLKFHPDRASKADIRQQVYAEETFKLISRLKEKLLPNQLFPIFR